MRQKFILIGICIAIISFFSNILFNTSICLFYNIFGIPCLTCGITRAYLRLIHLDFRRAFYYHPLFLLAPTIFFIKSNKYLLFIFSTFIVVWIIRMYLYFPDIEPMVFNKNALYIKILKIISYIIKKLASTSFFLFINYFLNFNSSCNIFFIFIRLCIP